MLTDLRHLLNVKSINVWASQSVLLSVSWPSKPYEM